LIRSIRKQYTGREARVLVLVEEALPEYYAFCKAQGGVVLVDYLGLMGMPIDLPQNLCPVRHLKVLVQYLALEILETKILFYMDSDAWILARLDGALYKLLELGPNSVLTWKDKNGTGMTEENVRGRLEFPEKSTYKRELFGFNAGVMFYYNGWIVRSYARHYLKHLYLQHSIPEQSICRGSIACAVGAYGLDYACESVEEARNWNPIWSDADQMELRNGQWFNLKNGKRQIIVHATGGKNRRTGREKPWQTPDHWSDSVLDSWRWVNGTESPVEAERCVGD
jgi:hypothetical protein